MMDVVRMVITNNPASIMPKQQGKPETICCFVHILSLLEMNKYSKRAKAEGFRLE